MSLNNGDILIHSFQPNDIPQCLNITRGVYAKYCPEDGYVEKVFATDMADIEKNYLNIKGGHWWVARTMVDNTVVGQVGIQPLSVGNQKCYQAELANPHYLHIHPDQICELRRMAVIPAYQKQRVGFKLLHTLIEFAQSNDYKAIHLTTLGTMTSACKFYARCGFTKGKVEQYVVAESKNGDTKVKYLKSTVFEHSSSLTEDDVRLYSLPISESKRLYVQHYWMLL